MRRGTLVVILFVVIAGAIIGVSQFLKNQPPLEVSIAVNPLAESWLREAVTGLNNTSPVINATQRIHFNVLVTDDLAIWNTTSSLTDNTQPGIWLPTSSASIQYSDRYTMLTDTLAQTPLVWGGYSSRVALATKGHSEPLDWPSVQSIADNGDWRSLGGESRWGYPKLAFARADTTMSGLGAILSAAGSFNQSSDLRDNATRGQFRPWMEPVINAVPNFQTLGADPAAAIARGPSTADIGLLPEALWLRNLNGLTDSDAFMFSYPAYQFMLDFPLAVRIAGNDTPQEERQAAQLLSDWLLQPAQQASAIRHGLRPADGALDENAQLFTAAEAYGIQLELPPATLVEPPSRNDIAGLIQWFNTLRR